jgi:hypothetical protein
MTEPCASHDASGIELPATSFLQTSCNIVVATSFCKLPATSLFASPGVQNFLQRRSATSFLQRRSATSFL